ncbi:hypothetical protein F4802DRAFT_615512 [Xylaria palmicola]|nr:hypothetical protein F4802DRAFT_615512 [Xylaria palmicola]
MSEAKLPPRYEIRPLKLEHLEWVKALFAHSFVFGSPLWRNLYPLDRTARFYGLYHASDYMIRHQIASGLSLGVFDVEYQHRNPGGGGLYFDFDDPGVGEDELLRQMDTPLVSIACAFDAFDAMDSRRVAPVTGRLPASASFHAALAAREEEEEERARDPDVAIAARADPAAPGQVLQRMGTATRADARGAGLMKAAAREMMRRAADAGFRSIRIQCFHDAVTAVWADPPAPFRGSVVGEVDTYSLGEADGDGGWRFPYRPVKQRLTKIYVALR